MPPEQISQSSQTQAPFAPSDALSQNKPAELGQNAECAFKWVVAFYETISLPKYRKWDKRKSLLEALFEEWKRSAGKDLFPLVRLLIPERDRDRGVYGIKEAKLADIVCKANSLTEHTTSYEKIKHWKAPVGKDKASGDFSDAVYEVLQGLTFNTNSTVTVDEVNDSLQRLTRKHGTTTLNAQVAEFQRITAKMTAVDIKWYIRLILKDLKLSLRENSVLTSLHPDAKDLFNTCSDLKQVCWELHDKNIALARENKEVKLNKAYRPMLCKRDEKGLANIIKLMDAKDDNGDRIPFYIEEKQDGERLQVHKVGDKYMFFSRKDKDYTYLYGSNKHDGAWTQYCHGAFHPDVEDCILDGEMLAYDPTEKKVMPFGTLKSAALGSNGAYCLYRVFDILYLRRKQDPKGKCLVEYQFKSRLNTLKAMIDPIPNRFEFCYSVPGTSTSDLKRELKRVLERGQEGLVVKHPLSKYTLNGRNESWIKLKPDYMDGHGVDFDLMVLGAFFGEGRRSGRYGSFLVGMVDDTDPFNKRYYSFCKVGSGFSIEILEIIREKFGDSFYPSDRSQENNGAPYGYVVGWEKDVVPDLWIEPKDSWVMEVVATEVVKSEVKNYGTELCLRFPRCKRPIRDDKTIDDIALFTEEARKTLIATAMDKDKIHIGDQFTAKRKTKRTGAASKKAKLSDRSQGADISDLQIKSSIFNRYVFRIYTDNINPKDTDDHAFRKELEKLVTQHGGTFHQGVKPTEDRDLIWISNKIGKATELSRARRNGFPILKPEWLFDCIANGKLVSQDSYTVGKDDAKGPMAVDRRIRTTPRDDSDLDPPSDADSDDDDSPVLKHKRPNGTIDEDSSQTLPDPDLTESDSDQGFRKGIDEQTTDVDSDDEPVPRFTPAVNHGVGGNSQQMDYDEEKLFKGHLLYFDTRENAERNGILGGTGLPSNERRDVVDVIKQVEELGGKVTNDFHDINITMVICDGSIDSKRRAVLIGDGETGRYRRAVKLSWINESIDESTLLPPEQYQA